MANISTGSKKKIRKRRDGQVNQGIDSAQGSTTVVTSSSAPSADLSTVVAKAGDTMSGDLEMDGAVLQTDNITEQSADSGVTIEGVNIKDAVIISDTIDEKTADHGVIIDGVLLKDSEVTTDKINEESVGAGVEIDGTLIKDGGMTLIDSKKLFFGDSAKGLTLQSDGTYLEIHGDDATAPLSLWIQETIANFYNYANVQYHGATSGDEIHFRGNVLDGNSFELNGLTGQMLLEGIQSKITAYVSGFTGTGFKLGSFTEVNDLIVRGSMKVYELIISKIRATNGSLWVTDSCKALSDAEWTGANYEFDVESGTNTFQAGDIIKAQRFNGSEVYSVVFKVYSVTTTTVTVQTEAGGFPDADDRACEGYDFVRIGNATNSTRQGALYLTSSDSNSPYIEVLDGMSSSTIGASNRKVRLGKLDGLSFDGTPIGGYGLYSDSAYLEGVIKAISGEIAAFTISGDSISSSNSKGDMSLDSSDSSLSVINTSGITKIRISPESIPALGSVGGASTKSWTGSYADLYTDVSQIFSATGSDDDTWYLNKNGTTSLYLDLDTAVQTEDYMLDIFTVGLGYATVLLWDTSLSYTIPTDDTDETDGTTTAYSLGGSYSQTITVTCKSNTGAVLATQVNTFNNRTTNLADVEIFNKVVSPTTSSLYFSIRVETTNDLYTDMQVGVWEYIDGSWQLQFTIPTSQDLATTFNMQVESLVMIGSPNQILIGENGLMHYNSTTKYFMINEDESSYIQSRGTWTHKQGSVIFGGTASADTARVIVNYGGSGAINPSYDFAQGALCINANYIGYAAYLYNSNQGTTAGRHGMTMRCGPTSHNITSDTNFLLCQDGNGTIEGAILSDSTSFRIYNASDERLKENITDLDSDGVIQKLLSLNPRSYTMIKNRETEDNPTQVGYIAQEMQQEFPRAVKENADGFLMISEGAMTPYLHSAIQKIAVRSQEQEVRIDTLESQIQILNDRLKALETA